MGFYFILNVNEEDKLSKYFVRELNEKLSENTRYFYPVMYNVESLCKRNKWKENIEEVLKDIAQQNPRDEHIEIFLLPLLNTIDFTLNEGFYEEAAKSLSEVKQEIGKFGRISNVRLWPFLYCRSDIADQENSNVIIKISQNVDLLTIFTDKTTLGGDFTAEDFYNHVLNFLLLISSFLSKGNVFVDLWNDLLPVNDNLKVSTFSYYNKLPYYVNCVKEKVLEVFVNGVTEVSNSNSQSSELLLFDLKDILNLEEKIKSDDLYDSKTLVSSLLQSLQLPRKPLEVNNASEYFTLEETQNKEIFLNTVEEAKCREKISEKMESFSKEMFRKTIKGLYKEIVLKFIFGVSINNIRQSIENKINELKSILENLSEDKVPDLKPKTIKEILFEFKDKHKSSIERINMERQRVLNHKYNLRHGFILAIFVFTILMVLRGILNFESNALILIVISLISLGVSFSLTYWFFKRAHEKKLKQLRNSWVNLIKCYTEFLQDRVSEYLLQLLKICSVKYQRRLLAHTLAELYIAKERVEEYFSFLSGIPDILKKKFQVINNTCKELEKTTSMEIEMLADGELESLKDELRKQFSNNLDEPHEIIINLCNKYLNMVKGIAAELAKKEEALSIITIEDADFKYLENRFTQIKIPKNHTGFYYYLIGQGFTKNIKTQQTFKGGTEHPKVSGMILYAFKKWQI